MTEEAAAAINAAERILAVGTTSVRVLESAVRQNDRFVAQEGATGIFIYPPYEFRAVDRLLTNFVVLCGRSYRLAHANYADGRENLVAARLFQCHGAALFRRAGSASALRYQTAIQSP